MMFSTWTVQFHWDRLSRVLLLKWCKNFWDTLLDFKFKLDPYIYSRYIFRRLPCLLSAGGLFAVQVASSAPHLIPARAGRHRGVFHCAAFLWNLQADLMAAVGSWLTAGRLPCEEGLGAGCEWRDARGRVCGISSLSDCSNPLRNAQHVLWRLQRVQDVFCTFVFCLSADKAVVHCRCCVRQTAFICVHCAWTCGSTGVPKLPPGLV